MSRLDDIREDVTKLREDVTKVREDVATLVANEESRRHHSAQLAEIISTVALIVAGGAALGLHP